MGYMGYMSYMSYMGAGPTLAWSRSGAGLDRQVAGGAGNIVWAQDEKLQAAAVGFLRAVGEGGRAGAAGALAHLDA